MAVSSVTAVEAACVCSSDCLPTTIAKSTSPKPTPVGSISSDLLCGACGELLKEPTQTSCGERFCQECFKALVKGNDDPACPDCEENIDQKSSWPDAFAAKELHELVVPCDAGCMWRGRKFQLEDHLRYCHHGLERCSNEVCSESMPISLTAKPGEDNCLFRLVSCEHCCQPVVLKSLSTHLETCDEIPVPCLNDHTDEGQAVPRGELPSHLEWCPRKQVHCNILKCTVKASTEVIIDHMESNVGSDVELINDVSVSLQQQVEIIRSNADGQLDEQDQIQRSCHDEIQDILQRTKDLEGQLDELSANQKLVQQRTLEACYQSVNNLQKEMNAKMEKREHHLRILTERCVKFEEIIAMQSARIQQLEEEGTRNKQTEQQQSQAQDRVLAAHDIKLAEHGLRLDMLDYKNVDGVLLWKITEIRRRRREAVSGKTPSIYSQPFYTSANGYRMCARLYLNGDGMGSGTHLSLFLLVMRGDYDSFLPWPFQEKVLLSLLDQDGQRHISDTFIPDPSSTSLQSRQREMNIASGCPLFVRLPTLDGGGYIKDDMMFIEIAVHHSNLRRPFAHSECTE